MHSLIYLLSKCIPLVYILITFLLLKYYLDPCIQLQLSATIRGKGSESIVLPKTVVAQYNGVNVTVQLPPGNMTFENTCENECNRLVESVPGN